MDPQACWEALASHWENKEIAEMRARAMDLLQWINRGGFPPKITGQESFDRQVAVVVCKMIYDEDRAFRAS